MPLPFSFSNNTSPTGPQLDTNEAQLGTQTIIPCTVSGTNSLTLTPLTNSSTVASYANYNRYSGVAVQTNTGAVQARVGALPLLNVYKDTPSGPVALTGSPAEIVQNCAFTLIYDLALNSGAGGFHLVSTTTSITPSGGTIVGSLTITDGVSFTSNLTPASLSTASLVATGASITGALTAASITGTSLFAGAASLTNATITGASLTTLRLGGASVTRIITGLGTLTYTVVPAQTAQVQNITLAGLQATDSLAMGYPSTVPAGIGLTAFVVAAGTLSVKALNATAASIAGFSLAPTRATAIGFT